MVRKTADVQIAKRKIPAAVPAIVREIPIRRTAAAEGSSTEAEIVKKTVTVTEAATGIGSEFPIRLQSEEQKSPQAAVIVTEDKRYFPDRT